MRKDEPFGDCFLVDSRVTSVLPDRRDPPSSPEGNRVVQPDQRAFVAAVEIVRAHWKSHFEV